MSIILGLTFGPSKPALRPQPYEVGPAFGPCLGDSPFCTGTGFMTLDPLHIGSATECFRQAVLCGACVSSRESKALAAGIWPEGEETE